MFREINVYCGFNRETVVRIVPKIVNDIVFEVPCFECDGTGVWDYFPEELPAQPCVDCKGTGKQYLGI